jgi:hypothetical protein
MEFDAGGSWMFGPGGKLPLHYHLFQDGSPKELPQVPYINRADTQANCQRKEQFLDIRIAKIETVVRRNRIISKVAKIGG